MINLRIDGLEIAAEAGMTILEAAKTAGIEIPTLCYLEGVNEIGSCRLCVVEVEGMDKLPTACNTKVKRRHGSTDKRAGVSSKRVKQFLICCSPAIIRIVSSARRMAPVNCRNTVMNMV